MRLMNFGKYKVKLTNEDKVLFPVSGITKGDLIRYYHAIADYMLPLVKDRPVTMRRFPDGIEATGFYQKDKSAYFPKWIESVKVKKENGETIAMILANNTATLVYLANQACITPHIWLSKKDKLNNPDKLIFDLDPPGDDFEMVINGAQALKKVLEEDLSLKTFIMTTGSKGLHVIVPLNRKAEFDAVRAFAETISQYVADQNEEHFTTEVRKNKRKGRLFLDYMRNAYAQTGVAPYAVRAIEQAPVATPLHWDELDEKKLHAKTFHIKNIFDRLESKENPWKDFNKYGADLDKPLKKMRQLLE